VHVAMSWVHVHITNPQLIQPKLGCLSYCLVSSPGPPSLVATWAKDLPSFAT